jgi:hypothetical protein
MREREKEGRKEGKRDRKKRNWASGNEERQ